MYSRPHQRCSRRRRSGRSQGRTASKLLENQHNRPRDAKFFAKLAEQFIQPGQSWADLDDDYDDLDAEMDEFEDMLSLSEPSPESWCDSVNATLECIEEQPEEEKKAIQIDFDRNRAIEKALAPPNIVAVAQPMANVDIVVATPSSLDSSETRSASLFKEIKKTSSRFASSCTMKWRKAIREEMSKRSKSLLHYMKSW